MSAIVQNMVGSCIDAHKSFYAGILGNGALLETSDHSRLFRVYIEEDISYSDRYRIISIPTLYSRFLDAECYGLVSLA